jgi:hypothetical protein
MYTPVGIQLAMGRLSVPFLAARQKAMADRKGPRALRGDATIDNQL